jgi:hypothetical protein
MNPHLNTGFVVSRMVSVFPMAAIPFMAGVIPIVKIPAASMARKNAANSREQGEEAY